MAWAEKGDALYYTRYPRKGERPDADLAFFQEVWRHQLGSPESSDTYEMGRGLPRIAEIGLVSEGQVVLVDVRNGDGGEHAFHVRRGSEWLQVSSFADRLVDGRIGLDGALYFVSLAGAPRGKILRVPIDTPSLLSARTVVEEQAGVIEEIEPTVSPVSVAAGAAAGASAAGLAPVGSGGGAGPMGMMGHGQKSGGSKQGLTAPSALPYDLAEDEEDDW